MKVQIEDSLCIACGLCREVCPAHAVHPKMQDIHHMYEVVAAECTGCGDCLPYSPRLERCGSTLNQCVWGPRLQF